jgi:hypothetical protein
MGSDEDSNDEVTATTNDLNEDKASDGEHPNETAEEAIFISSFY